MTRMTGRRLPLFLLILVSFATLGRGEIRKFTGVLEAASTFVHYSEGWLVAPAYIDISDLVFETIDDGTGDDIVGADDEPYEEEEEEEEGDEFVQVDDDKLLDVDDKLEDDDGSVDDDETRFLSDEKDPSSSMIDIVAFHQPNECASNRNGCDWTKLGIGASDGKGGVRWCCSNDAMDFGFCEGGTQFGRLIVNSTLFKGQHRFLSIQKYGKVSTFVKYGKLEEADESGKYVLVLANCNDAGRDVLVSGTYVWHSNHGYLPGDYFGEMYFFVVLTVVYLGLLGWYGISMRLYEDAQIPIQKWILGTIVMGLMESFFRTGDYFVWNEDGTRFWFAWYSALTLGVLKRGVSRCLVVMVSLGWGVVRDTLGSQFIKVVILGVLYIGFEAAREIMTTFAYAQVETLKIEEETEIIDVVTVLTFIVAAIDVIFYLWILDSLNGTMQYLENMSQTRKLTRYLRLRCILLISILLAVVWAVFGIVSSTTDDAIVQEESEWAVNALMELNYLFVLSSVAWLWRPSPTAKEFAYVMELPALGVGEDGEAELEMTAAVPSAMDEDEEGEEGEFSNGNGSGPYKDGDGDLKLSVEDGVTT